MMPRQIFEYRFVRPADVAPPDVVAVEGIEREAFVRTFVQLRALASATDEDLRRAMWKYARKRRALGLPLFHDDKSRPTKGAIRYARGLARQSLSYGPGYGRTVVAKVVVGRIHIPRLEAA